LSVAISNNFVSESTSRNAGPWADLYFDMFSFPFITCTNSSAVHGYQFPASLPLSSQLVQKRAVTAYRAQSCIYSCCCRFFPSRPAFTWSYNLLHYCSSASSPLHAGESFRSCYVLSLLAGKCASWRLYRAMEQELDGMSIGMEHSCR
jgi:hypothetical protein